MITGLIATVTRDHWRRTNLEKSYAGDLVSDSPVALALADEGYVNPRVGRLFFDRHIYIAYVDEGNHFHGGRLFLDEAGNRIEEMRARGELPDEGFQPTIVYLKTDVVDGKRRGE